MKKISLLIMLAGLVWGCSTPPGPAPTRLPATLTARPPGGPTVSPTTTLPTVSASPGNDFEPPQGIQPNAPPESPGLFRLIKATSPDGLTFTSTGEIVLDQANVPDMIMDATGRIYLYFAGGQMGDKNNVIAVALSDDLGQTWVFKHLQFSGPPSPPVGDPDVVLLPDGTIRLYATTQVGDNIGIIYTDSPDGIHFGQRATAFAIPGANVLDSTTFLMGDVWHMFVLDGFTPDQWHATSTDGLTFTPVTKHSFKVDNQPYIVSNPVFIENGVRLYGFSGLGHPMRSFTSTDGETWTLEPDERLTFDPNSAIESVEIKDPAVLQLAGGSYLMIYVTKIPR